MRRREFIGVLGGAAAAWPLEVRAQQPSGKRRVGVLLAFDESDSRPQAWLAAFTKGLSELGWTAGRNLQIDVRWAGNDVNLMQKFAKELVALKPDVILSFGTPVTAALQRETRTVPIVFAIVSDPVGEALSRVSRTRVATSPAFTIRRRRSEENGLNSLRRSRLVLSALQ